MSRIFITGSTEGLGRAAALDLLDDGHEVVLHARNPSRAASLGDQIRRGAAMVTGDLASADETHHVADQVSALGRMDAVIHNAAVFKEPERGATPEGHARTLAVNVLAPYMLTAEITRPGRLIDLSSDMHRGGDASLHDLDWPVRAWNGMQAYDDSKLFMTAFASMIARRWPVVRSNAVDPGWERRGWAGRAHRMTLNWDT